MTIQVLRETHNCPQSIQDCLTALGGKNPFGEPIFRAVWGWNRLTLIYGKWQLADMHGNVTGEHEEWARVPLYTPPHFDPNRWYIERWRSAEDFFGSPEAWLQSADGNPTMPFNSRGEYDHYFTVQTPGGEFVQLTRAIAAEAVRRFHAKCAESRGDKQALKNETLHQEDKSYDSYADTVLSDTNQFQGKIHVYQ